MTRIVPPGRAVLDVGCRDGGTLFGLSEHMTRGTGVDIDRDSISAARRRKAEIGADGLELQFGDAVSRNLPDRSFDVAMVLGDVLSYTNLHGKTERLISEMRRVLAPGGKLVIDGTQFREHPVSCIPELL